MNKAVIALIICGVVVVFAIVIVALILTLRSSSTADDDEIGEFECGKRYTNIEPRLITNGSDAVVGSAPWYVDFRFFGNLTYNGTAIPLDGHQCGGSIIASEWVITATHCIGSPPNRSVPCDDLCIVVAGSVKHERINGSFPHATVHKVVQKIPFDENYESLGGKDIALLKVSPPFEYRTAGPDGRRAIGPVCLPNKQDEPVTQTEGDIVGLGGTNDTLRKLAFDKRRATGNRNITIPNQEEPENLQSAHVRVISREECAKIPFEKLSPYLKNMSNWEELYLAPQATICAGNLAHHQIGCQVSKLQCQLDNILDISIKGDSGGPLTVDIDGKATLVGITNAGLTEYCIVDPVWYDVFAKVSHFRDWIRKVSGV